MWYTKINDRYRLMFQTADNMSIVDGFGNLLKHNNVHNDINIFLLNDYKCTVKTPGKPDALRLLDMSVTIHKEHGTEFSAGGGIHNVFIFRASHNRPRVGDYVHLETLSPFIYMQKQLEWEGIVERIDIDKIVLWSKFVHVKIPVPFVTIQSIKVISTGHSISSQRNFK